MNLRQKKKKLPDPDVDLAPVTRKRTRRKAILSSSTNGNVNTKLSQKQNQNQSVVQIQTLSVYENRNGNSKANGHMNGNGNYHHELIPYQNGNHHDNDNDHESDNDSFASSDYDCFELPSIVRDAITSLNATGATLASIIKYIRETYPNVNLDLFTPFLMDYLHDAVMAGKVQKKNKTYQLVTKKRRLNSAQNYDDEEQEEEDEEEGDESFNCDDNQISEINVSECRVMLEPLSPRLIVPVLLRDFCHTQNLFNYTSSVHSANGIDEDCWSLSQEFFESEYESLIDDSRQFYIHLHDDRIIKADRPIHIQIQNQFQDQNDNDNDNQFNIDDDEKVEENRMIMTMSIPKPKILRKKLKIVKAMIIRTLHHSSMSLALEVRDVNLFTPEIQDFVAFTQNSITHFSFGKRLYSDRLIRENVLLDFITHHLSHLKYLAICDDMIDSWEDESIGTESITVSRPLLLKLKTIRFIQGKKNGQVFTQTFISEILGSAPNLMEIYGLPFKYLNLVEISKKIKAVKSISGFYEHDEPKEPDSFKWDDENQNQNENHDDKEEKNINNNNNTNDLFFNSMKTLSRTKLECEILDLRGMSNDRDEQFEFEFEKEKGTKIMEIYTNLLVQSSYNYLKKLIIRPLGAKLINVRFPTLETVTDLQLVFVAHREDLTTKIFPAGWDLNRIFPSLSNVEIKFDWTGVKTSVEWKSLKSMQVVNLFPKTSVIMENADDRPSIFLSVKHLVLTNSTMRIQLYRLANFFQNIQQLSIRTTACLLKYRLPYVFSAWPKLEELTLELDVACAHICLDSALLGMSDPSLKHFEREKFPELTEEDERKYRTCSSICQLKDLKILRLSFYRDGGIFREKKSLKEKETKWLFFTPAVGIYGFSKKIMPHLNVRIKFDASCTSDDICRILNMWKPLVGLISIEM